MSKDQSCDLAARQWWCETMVGLGVRDEARAAHRVPKILECVPNRAKVIRRVRDDRHAVIHLLFPPGLKSLERLDQFSIFAASAAFEFLPFPISHLLWPRRRA